MDSNLAMLWQSTLAPDLRFPAVEHKFCDTRRWRFDCAFEDVNLAIEAEGGSWVAGRHSRGKGYAADCQKYNTAVELGWVVLRYTSDMLENDPSGVIEQIKRVYASRKG